VLLRDEEWKQWNDHEIGRQCNVSHHTVAKVREELYPPVTRHLPSEKTYKTKHGTTAKMKTGFVWRRVQVWPNCITTRRTGNTTLLQLQQRIIMLLKIL
jgi:hypothetical protein